MVGKMRKVRCEICRHHLPTLKNLKSHYMIAHSKVQIIKELLKISLLKATPNLFMRALKRKKEHKQKTIYLHKNIHITYSNDIIIIKDESSTDHLIELTFENPQNFNLPKENPNFPIPGTSKELNKDYSNNNSINHKRRTKRDRKSKKLFHIGFKKLTESTVSLNEHTGEFYECHCRKNSYIKTSSDTDSCSDSLKWYYCNSCGNGYNSTTELIEHEKQHQFTCNFCNENVPVDKSREHLDKHIIRLFVCHICSFEFISKGLLDSHLNHHYEQTVLETVLGLEQDYCNNMSQYHGFRSFLSGTDYQTSMNNILFYLASPHDLYFSRKMFMNIKCEVCGQDCFLWEYERHLKMFHIMV